MGVGIFFTPAEVARRVDTPTQALVAWLVGGALALCGALVFAELAALRPGPGGMYRYVRDGFGPGAGFLYGWTNALVVQAGAQGVIGLVMAENLDRVLFAADATGTPGRHVLVALVAIVAFTLLNARGLDAGRRAQWLLTGAKLLGVLGLAALALVAGRDGDLGEQALALSGDARRGLLTTLPAALLPVLFAYGGWQHGSFVVSAVRRPTVDVPLGLVGGVVVVVASYVALNLGLFDLLGHDEMAASRAVAADAARVGLETFGHGELASRLLALAVVVSSLGVLNTICLSPPWVLHAMGREGQLPAVFGRLAPRAGVPTAAILTQGLWAAGLLAVVALVRRDDPGSLLGFLLDGVVFADWLFYGLCGLALLRLRGLPGGVGFRAPGGAAVALVFVLAAGTVAVAALVSNPAATLAGGAALVLGALVHRAGWLGRAPD